MTYAIIARDRATGEIGAAVQSHFFNVGSVVLWPEPGIGIIATMATAEPAYGKFGLELLRSGLPSQIALDELVQRDAMSLVRQVGVMSVQGPPAAFTGSACIPAAGHRVESDVVALGNLLTHAGTWDRMVDAFLAAKGVLAQRLITALEAAEDAGGDLRGQQSAAILVVSAVEPPHADSPPPFSVSPRIDLRVEDNARPIAELKRLLALDMFYKALLGLLQTPGLLVGEAAVDEAAYTDAFGTLNVGRQLLGENQEAAFWLAVLLIRAGRIDDARRQFRAATTARPPLRELAQRIAHLGLISQSQLAALIE